MKRLVLFLLLTTAFALQAEGPKIFHRILAKPLINLSPQKLEDEYSIHIMSQCLMGLLTLGDDNRVEPAIASDWSLSRDKKTYTFKLRPGLRYSDGRPFRAIDFLKSMESVMRADSVVRKEMSLISGAEAFANGKRPYVSGIKIVDPETIKITLDRPFPSFLFVISAPTFGILNDADIKNLRAKKVAKFASLGPYYIKDITEKQIILFKNPYYYKKDSVYFDEIHYDFVDDELAAIDGFLKGKYQDIFPFRVPDEAAIKANALKIPTFTAASWYLEFNLNKPLVNSLQFRRFLFKHFNFDEFLKAAGKPPHFRAYGIIPRGFIGFKEKRSLKEPLDDLKVLAAVGCTVQTPCRLTVEHPYSELQAPLEIGFKDMNEQFKQVHVTAKLEERLSWYQKFIKDDYSVVAVGNASTYPDTLLYLKYLSDPIYHPGLERKEILKLLDASLKTDSKETRKELFEKADDILFDQMGIIPLFFGEQPYRWVSGKLEPFSSPLIGFNRIRIDKLREKKTP